MWSQPATRADLDAVEAKRERAREENRGYRRSVFRDAPEVRSETGGPRHPPRGEMVDVRQSGTRARQVGCDGLDLPGREDSRAPGEGQLRARYRSRSPGLPTGSIPSVDRGNRGSDRERRSSRVEASRGTGAGSPEPSGRAGAGLSRSIPRPSPRLGVVPKRARCRSEVLRPPFRPPFRGLRGRSGEFDFARSLPYPFRGTGIPSSAIASWMSFQHSFFMFGLRRR